jgi:hypothetical protein
MWSGAFHRKPSNLWVNNALITAKVIAIQNAMNPPCFSYRATPVAIEPVDYIANWPLVYVACPNVVLNIHKHLFVTFNPMLRKDDESFKAVEVSGTWRPIGPLVHHHTTFLVHGFQRRLAPGTKKHITQWCNFKPTSTFAFCSCAVCLPKDHSCSRISENARHQTSITEACFELDLNPAWFFTVRGSWTARPACSWSGASKGHLYWSNF